jgi:RNA polymerase sigma factor (sigma-70 family)
MSDRLEAGLGHLVMAAVAERGRFRAEAAVGRLLGLHAAAYRLALSVLGSDADAEDAVQQAYLAAVRQLRMQPPSQNERAWFLKIVTNQARLHIRGEVHRRRREAMAAAERAVETSTAPPDGETLRALRRELDGLSEEHRLPLVLCYQEGLTQREAAAVLDVAESTLSERLQAALEALRLRLRAAGHAVAIAGLAGAIRTSAPELPAGLADRIQGVLNSGDGIAGAGPGGLELKGGLIVKIGLGIAAVGLVAGATFWAVGGRTGEPAKSPPAAAPEKKSAFDTPIWHPDAEWESTGRFLGSVMPASAGWLDGPKGEMMSRGGGPRSPWGSPYGGHERCVWACMDEKTERYHVVAGAEVYGYLDGPFSRARHGGWIYMDRAFSLMTPDRRYLYTSDVFNGRMIRRLDFMKQEIATVQWEVENFTGLTMGQDGKIYALTPPHLAVLNQDGKLERKIALELKGDVGWEANTAHDPKRNRMWATSGHNPKRQWHVWYWDLADGSFHGEVPAKAKQPGDHMFGGAPGSYKDGWFVYPQSCVYFGPDDPDYRLLYMSHTDCGNSHRLDLEKKEVWVLSGPPRNKSGPIRYVFKREEINPFEPHTGPSWRPDGDFTMPTGGSAGLGIVLYKRVK